MFKSRDLSMFALMFVIFRHDKPVDWILTEIARLKYCRTDVEPKECRRVLSNKWLYSRPSLFQHIGTHSSLKGKVQKLKDKQFGRVAQFTPHLDNPPALVNSTIKQYERYSLNKAYLGESYFWGFTPSAGDVLWFNFTPPVLISGFLFRSGNNEHPQDKFPVSTIIDVLPEQSSWSPSNSTIDPSFSYSTTSISQEEKGVTGHSTLSFVSVDSSHPKPSSQVKTTDGFVEITRFRSNGLAEGTIPKELARIKSLRIRCPVASEKWVILSEVSFSSSTLLYFFYLSSASSPSPSSSFHLTFKVELQTESLSKPEKKEFTPA